MQPLGRGGTTLRNPHFCNCCKTWSSARPHSSCDRVSLFNFFRFSLFSFLVTQQHLDLAWLWCWQDDLHFRPWREGLGFKAPNFHQFTSGFEPGHCHYIVSIRRSSYSIWFCGHSTSKACSIFWAQFQRPPSDSTPATTFSIRITTYSPTLPSPLSW